MKHMELLNDSYNNGVVIKRGFDIDYQLGIKKQSMENLLSVSLKTGNASKWYRFYHQVKKEQKMNHNKPNTTVVMDNENVY